MGWQIGSKAMAGICCFLWAARADDADGAEGVSVQGVLARVE